MRGHHGGGFENALNHEEHVRRQYLLRQACTQTESTRELPDGYEIRFANPSLGPFLAELLLLERRRHPFLVVSLDFGRAESPLRMRVSCSREAKGALFATDALDGLLPKIRSVSLLDRLRNLLGRRTAPAADVIRKGVLV
jgi:hypothetical protein